MCGIVGYVGHRDAAEFLLAGLRRLEYRGYDSAGIATLHHDALCLQKMGGRVQNLAERLETHPLAGSVGIGHTRWATHGPATDENAHPHFGGNNTVAIVHNGVIENFQGIKEKLIGLGYQFQSATDSEVIAHAICEELGKQDMRSNDRYEPLVEAVRGALAQLRGTYGLVVLFRDHPEVLIAARLGSPLVVGVGKNEHYVASDASPLVGYTDKIVYLADHQLAVVTADELRVTHRDHGHVKPNVKEMPIQSGSAGLDGYKH